MARLKKFVLFLIFIPFSADCDEIVSLISSTDQLLLNMINGECLKKDAVQNCLELQLVNYLEKVLNTTSLALTEGLEFVQTSPMNQSKLDISRMSRTNFSDTFMDKIAQLVSSRTLRIHLAQYGEGRGKKAKKQYMAVGLLIAAIMAAIKFQALSFFVGKAFTISNIALLAAGFLAFKLLLPGNKMKNTQSEVVYVEPNIDSYSAYMPPIRD